MNVTPFPIPDYRLDKATKQAVFTVRLANGVSPRQKADRLLRT